MTPSKTLLAFGLALICAAPAWAQSPTVTTCSTLAELQAKVADGTVQNRDLVRLDRVRITTEPEENESDHSDWVVEFLVNDPGASGDGVKVELPLYGYWSVHPFEPEYETDFEADLDFPKLERGYEVGFVARVLAHSSLPGGFVLTRDSDTLADELFFDFHEQVESEDGGYWTTYWVQHKFDVHSSVHDPFPKPSNVSVTRPDDLKPGGFMVIRANDLFTPARVKLDNRFVEVKARLPGILVARLPLRTTPGPHTVTVINPGDQASDPVQVTVKGLRPRLTSAVRAGDQVIISGHFLHGGTNAEVRMGSTLLPIVTRANEAIVAEVPAGTPLRRIRVTIDGQRSNRVYVQDAGDATATGATGILSSTP